MVSRSNRNFAFANLYVLNGGCIGDRYVVGVFSSKKKAEAAMEWIIQNDTYYKSNPDELDIDVFEMNGEQID